MAVSDADFIVWRRSGLSRRCLLVFAAYTDLDTMIDHVLTVSNFGYHSASPDYSFPDLIVNEPYIRYKHKEPLGVSKIELHNNGELDNWLAYGWDGRQIDFYLGDPDWAFSDFRHIFNGTIKDASISDNTFIINVRDIKELFNLPVHYDTYASGDAKGKVIPAAYGKLFNISPVLTDEATHQYDLSYAAIHQVLDVRDNGVSVGYTHNAGDTFIRLTAQPVGEITLDIEGDLLGGTYSAQLADIVKFLLIEKGLLSTQINAANFAQFKADYPIDVGVYLNQRTNAVDLIDTLLDEIDAGWYFDSDQKLNFYKLTPPVGNVKHVIDVDDYIPESFTVSSNDPPAWKLRFGVDQNNTVQSPDALAGAVTEANRVIYGQDFKSIITAHDAGIKTSYKLAEEPDLIHTHWVSGSYADNEATRQLAVRDRPRLNFTIKCTGYTPQTAQLNLRLGDEISLLIGRAGFGTKSNSYVLKTLGELNWGVDPLGAYKLSPGALTSNAILTGVTEYITTGEFELDFWK